MPAQEEPPIGVGANPARSPYQFNPRLAKAAPIMSAKGTPRKA